MNFIPAEYYSYINVIIIISLTLMFSSRVKTDIGRTQDSPLKKNLIWSIAIFFSLFIGLRPISHVFVDMAGTAAIWEYRVETIHGIDLRMNNFIYENIPRYMDSIGLGKEDFFLLMACLYYIGTAYACKRIFGNNALIAYLVWLASFSTFSYATNGIKAGAAATWFIMALSFHNKKIFALLLLFITIGFHHSMVLPVLGYIVCTLYNRPKWYFIFWIGCLVLSSLHITSIMEFLGGLLMSNDDEQGAEYLLGGQQYVIKQGFRIDFVIYSAIPIIVGYWIIFKRHIESNYYNFIYGLYAFINGFWLLCMYASFTNRIAYLSWLVYPIVLIYPFLKMNLKTSKQGVWANRIIWGNVIFTAFMLFIYY